MRFSTEDSIGVPLFRTVLEKLVRPGVSMPAEDGMTAVSLDLQKPKGNFSSIGLNGGE